MRIRGLLSLAALAAGLAATPVLARAVRGESPASPRVTIAVSPAPTGAVSEVATAATAATAAAAATNAVAAVATNAIGVVREGWYYDRDRVAAYIRAFGRLPGNYITKSEARRLGWQGGPLEPFAPGKAIGGDRFGNYEGRLPRGDWRECDIDTRGRPRGVRRLIYSGRRDIYYTGDHYRTFRRINR